MRGVSEEGKKGAEKMGAVEIRRLTKAELELSLPIWSQAFEQGETTMDEWREMEQRYGDRNVTFGLFDSAGLQAAVLVTDCARKRLCR
jgi:hypothetical protein